ncbi:MAG: TGS domain-containing protein, partial [Desulfurococcales archaeon]|nr:TGS domain-containing protein [Desulfurococcales archaeon]
AGAGQAVLLGPPNSGKSSLLARLTNAKPEIAPYPFTTQLPIPGMLSYEDIQIQLVDTPPLLLDQPDSPVNNRVLGVARNANILILVVGLDDPNPLETARRLLSLLGDRGILVTRARGLVRIMKSRQVTGVKVQGTGRMVGFTEEDLKRLLSSYRIYNAVVEIEGEVTLDDVEAAVFQQRIYKPSLMILNKADLPHSKEAVAGIRKLLPSDVPLLVASAKTGRGLEGLGEMLFKMLGVIRVYTKQPNKEPDPQPLIIERGATVIEAARRIHKDLARNFKYAKIWGKSAKYPGQKVGPDHVLEDKDLVEIHTR